MDSSPDVFSPATLGPLKLRNRVIKAATFEAARAKFEAAWQDYVPRCTAAAFQTWRDQQAWTKEKYRRFDRGEPMPPDWRPPRMGAGCAAPFRLYQAVPAVEGGAAAVRPSLGSRNKA